MTAQFWAKRFFMALVIAFAVIGAAQLLRGRDVGYAITHAAIWSVITAIVFTVASWMKARRARDCVVCKEAPEMRE